MTPFVVFLAFARKETRSSGLKPFAFSTRSTKNDIRRQHLQKASPHFVLTKLSSLSTNKLAPLPGTARELKDCCTTEIVLSVSGWLRSCATDDDVSDGYFFFLPSPSILRPVATRRVESSSKDTCCLFDSSVTLVYHKMEESSSDSIFQHQA